MIDPLMAKQTGVDLSEVPVDQIRESDLEVEVSTTPESQLEEFDRLTVICKVYHEHFGEEATGLEPQFERYLDTVEQPYGRRIKLTEEWSKLDCGWMKEAGLMVICNLAGTKKLQVVPAEEEILEVSRKIVNIHYCSHGDYEPNPDPYLPFVPHTIILPGEFQLSVPVECRHIWAKCLSGRCEIQLYLFSK